MAEITEANFDYAGYNAKHGIVNKLNDPKDKTKIWAHYQNAQQLEKGAEYTPGGEITPQNVTDYGGQTVQNTGNNIINAQNGTSVAAGINNAANTGTAAQVNANDPKYTMGTTPTVDAQQVTGVTNPGTAGYEVDKTEGKVADNTMDAAQGQVSQGAQLTDDEIAQHDLNAIASGKNADGTDNVLGQALNKHASLNLDDVDPRATVKGQVEQLQKDFVDPVTGEPKIPLYAQGAARNVAKIAAFSGMTGTAATAAMAQAMMESSITMATEDAKFFQTVTLTNLSNEQQSIINTANVLSKMAEQNVDNRMAAAIQNSKAFMDMDLANLNNEQQARVINNQARIQSILEDSKAENTKRMFEAESENEMNKFYDQLNTQIKQFNSTQTLDADKFNASMEDSREKFYKEMQYNIDISNAKWRQEVQLQDDQQKFEAVTQDVKNAVDLTAQQLNQLWDRSDALLDYIWKSGENQKDRDAQMAIAKFQAKAGQKGQTAAAIGSIVGNFVGSEAGSDMISGALGKMFS